MSNESKDALAQVKKTDIGEGFYVVTTSSFQCEERGKRYVTLVRRKQGSGSVLVLGRNAGGTKAAAVKLHTDTVNRYRALLKEQKKAAKGKKKEETVNV